MQDPGSKDRLAALGAAFAARLEKDAAQLHDLVTVLDERSGPEFGTLLEDIRSTAHRLRGTAPAFDAADIGELAGKLEDEIVRSPGEPTPRMRERLIELATLIDTALGAHGPQRQFRPRLL
jgi:HPt (histidine-containing phosphotransfer) domain-containing protein